MAKVTVHVRRIGRRRIEVALDGGIGARLDARSPLPAYAEVVARSIARHNFHGCASITFHGETCGEVMAKALAWSLS